VRKSFFFAFTVLSSFYLLASASRPRAVRRGAAVDTRAFEQGLA